jgi:hypothetical protein
MTIKELKQAIADLPDDMDVYIGERLTMYEYGLVNSLRVGEIDFYNEDVELLRTEKALILTEA